MVIRGYAPSDLISVGPARIRGGGGGHANFRTVRGGVMRKLAYKRGGLSDFTILFHFKEMCLLFLAVLKWYMISSF